MDPNPKTPVTLQIYLESGDPRAKPTAEIPCRSGLNLQAVAARHPDLFPVDFDCRKADCGVCLIKVRGQEPFLSPPTGAEKDFLKAMGCLPDGPERLACQARVIASGGIELIPP